MSLIKTVAAWWLLALSPLLTLSGCGGSAADATDNGPVENELIELTRLYRSDTGEPLPTLIEIHRDEAYYIQIELKAKVGRPAQWNGVNVSQMADCPSVWLAYATGTTPDLKLKPGGPTVRFACLSRHPGGNMIPLGPGTSWFDKAPKDARSQTPADFTQVLKEVEPGIAPYWSVLGATHPEPGEYVLQLYTYPTFHQQGRQLVPGEPLLVWSGTLKILD